MNQNINQKIPEGYTATMTQEGNIIAVQSNDELLKPEHATAICTCKTCGNKFTKQSKAEFTSMKRLEQWSEWAEKTYDECSDCWKERIYISDIDHVKEIGAPDITTGSKKQIQFATDLRARTLRTFGELPDFYKRVTDAKEIIDYILKK